MVLCIARTTLLKDVCMSVCHMPVFCRDVERILEIHPLTARWPVILYIYIQLLCELKCSTTND